ncbi:hypothetical protein [Mastigocoleus testarum]|uniref:Uncharacterized protein n=1 Tax=Mastigocoleus testarum BC008 TaxID=371196 RepID=A0A0V7ZGX6_9CYAN|nr:hypothetical protein [Mastigocoleus testarum]KST63752.1 hypothetical protein BC008_14965 [Mastigocoleus testarum BC008]
MIFKTYKQESGVRTDRALTSEQESEVRSQKSEVESAVDIKSDHMFTNVSKILNNSLSASVI